MLKKQKYTQNILDGVQLIESFAAEISSNIPKENQYEALMDAITHIHQEALAQHNVAVQYTLGVNWTHDEYIKNLKQEPTA